MRPKSKTKPNLKTKNKPEQTMQERTNPGALFF